MIFDLLITLFHNVSPSGSCKSAYFQQADLIKFIYCNHNYNFKNMLSLFDEILTLLVEGLLLTKFYTFNSIIKILI